MRFKRILWVWAAFVFASGLYAQAGQAPSGQTQVGQTQSQDPPAHELRCLIVRDDYMSPVTFTQVQIKAQAVLRRQLEDHGQVPELMTEKELTREIKSAPAEAVIKEVKGRGVDFDMTSGIEKKLRKANASDEVIEATRQAGPKVRTQMAKMVFGGGAAWGQDVPKEQARGFSLVVGEPNPDKALALADRFTKQYPSSPLLGYVYTYVANAYQQKGDVEKVVAYTGYSLNFNPDNLTSLILRVGALPQPQYLRNHAAYGGRILQEALSEGNHALELIAQIPRQTDETEAAHQKLLADYASEIHGPLGTVYLELATDALGDPDKAELAKAEQEFTTAVTTSSHPDPRDYYRLGEAYGLDGKWDEAIQAFKKAGGLGQGTLIKTYADEQIAQMKKRRGQESVASHPGAVSPK